MREEPTDPTPDALADDSLADDSLADDSLADAGGGKFLGGASRSWYPAPFAEIPVDHPVVEPSLPRNPAVRARREQQ
jgi:hypothetical protein